MKLVIEEEFYGLFLENDNTGSVIESRALGEGFRRQDKRHITVLSGSTRELLKNILDKLSLEEKRVVLDKIKNIFEGLKWEFKPKEIYRIKKTGYVDNPNILENRESYINIVEMPDMEIFYLKLNSLLKSNLPTQIPHITLFTKGERENPKWYGIPIPSTEEFNSMNPEKIY
ncbi:MAG: hypothetical protein AAB902_02155 [Patescibacteria group bacterium]